MIQKVLMNPFRLVFNKKSYLFETKELYKILTNEKACEFYLTSENHAPSMDEICLNRPI